MSGRRRVTGHGPAPPWLLLPSPVTAWSPSSSVSTSSSGPDGLPFFSPPNSAARLHAALYAGELDLAWQLQRLGKSLVRRETKTEDSDSTLPLPDICVAALRAHSEATRDRITAVGPQTGSEPPDLHEWARYSDGAP